MSTPDVARTPSFKERVLQVWTDAEMVAAWRRWRRHFALYSQPLTAVLVQAAQIQPGMRVLDVASGAGEPAITLAHLVGPHGHVTATDLSPSMVAIIDEVAREQGLTNLSCHHVAAEALPFPALSFDAVTCRLGVMFFADVAQALCGIRRVLKPGGHTALLVWGPEHEQARYTSTYGVVKRYVDVPTPASDEPSPYAFAAPGSLGAALRAAGFQRVEEVTHRLVLPWPGAPAEFWQHVCESSTPLRRALENLPSEQRAHVIEEIQTALRPYDDGQRVNMPACVHVATGVR